MQLPNPKKWSGCVRLILTCPILVRTCRFIVIKRSMVCIMLIINIPKLSGKPLVSLLTVPVCLNASFLKVKHCEVPLQVSLWNTAVAHFCLFCSKLLYMARVEICYPSAKSWTEWNQTKLVRVYACYKNSNTTKINCCTFKRCTLEHYLCWFSIKCSLWSLYL